MKQQKKVKIIDILQLFLFLNSPQTTKLIPLLSLKLLASLKLKEKKIFSNLNRLLRWVFFWLNDCNFMGELTN
jgi:hypothetical protein